MNPSPDTKTCSKCLKTKPLADYNIRSDRQVPYSMCKLCGSKASLKWAQNNRGRRNAIHRKAQKKAHEAKAATPCKDCNEQHPHYVMVRDGKSGEYVCANCYRTRQHMRANNLPV